MPELLTLRAMPGAGRVDIEKRVIHGAVILKTGDARGHGLHIDETTLDQVVALGNAAPDGVKARFGHPGPMADGIGSFLGRWKNFHREGDTVRADLHLSEAADPVKAEHVLKMARLEPDMIGNSVSIQAAREARRGGVPALRVIALEAVDVVDEPATGAGMFSRLASFLGFKPETPATAGEQIPMDLIQLRVAHPDLCGQIAEEAAQQERDRVIKILSKCGEEHLAKTKEHPDGFALAAIRDGVALESALETIFDLRSRAAQMRTMLTETALTMIPTTPHPNSSTPAGGSLEDRFFKIYRKQGKPETVARRMAQAAAGKPMEN